MVVGYVVQIIKKILKMIAFFPSKAYAAFDVKDFLVFGGLGMLGYGLYLKWGQWLAFIVCGILFMIIGYLMRGK